MFCWHVSAQQLAQVSTYLDSCLWVFILVVVQDFSSIALKSVTSAVGYPTVSYIIILIFMDCFMNLMSNNLCLSQYTLITRTLLNSVLS